MESVQPNNSRHILRYEPRGAEPAPSFGWTLNGAGFLLGTESATDKGWYPISGSDFFRIRENQTKVKGSCVSKSIHIQREIFRCERQSKLLSHSALYGCLGSRAV